MTTTQTTRKILVRLDRDDYSDFADMLGEGAAYIDYQDWAYSGSFASDRIAEERACTSFKDWLDDNPKAAESYVPAVAL